VVVAITEVTTASAVVEAAAEGAWVAAVVTGEEVAGAVGAVAEVAAAAVVECVGAVLVAAGAEVAGAALGSELATMDWVAWRSPIGLGCDAKTGSSMAEATMASNNERVDFFILNRSAGSA